MRIQIDDEVYDSREARVNVEETVAHFQKLLIENILKDSIAPGLE